MAVTVTTELVLRPWGGMNPSYRWPTNVWTAFATGNGDASGGNLTVTFNFKAGVLYSLENIAVNYNTGGVPVQLFLNMADGGLDATFAVELEGTISALGNAMKAHQTTPWQMIWRPDGSVQSSLQTVTLNAAGRILNPRAWGFIWDLEASRAPGGPIRV